MKRFFLGLVIGGLVVGAALTAVASSEQEPQVVPIELRPASTKLPDAPSRARVEPVPRNSAALRSTAPPSAAPGDDVAEPVPQPQTPVGDDDDAEGEDVGGDD